MIVNPCKDCEFAGCGVYHDKCPDYQNFKKLKAEEGEFLKGHKQLKEDQFAIRSRHYMAAMKYHKRG